MTEKSGGSLQSETARKPRIPKGILSAGAVVVAGLAMAGVGPEAASVKAADPPPPTEAPATSTPDTVATEIAAVKTETAKQINANAQKTALANAIDTATAVVKPPSATPTSTKMPTPTRPATATPTSTVNILATATAQTEQNKEIAREVSTIKADATNRALETAAAQPTLPISTESPAEKGTPTVPKGSETPGGVPWGIIAAGGAVAGVALTKLFASEKVKNTALVPVKFVRRFIQGFRGGAGGGGAVGGGGAAGNP